MKLHIGCGPKYIPGFKHLDVMDAEHIDFVCDTRKLDMIEDNSIKEIYACHILEHVVSKDVPDVIAEWYRVLSPEGLLRIAVPDFEAVVQEYNKTGDLMQLQGLLYGGQTYDYNFHYQAYDLGLMKNMLEKTGFKNVERYDWRDFLPEDYDDFSRAYLPHMDFEKGRLMSLNITAKK